MLHGNMACQKDTKRDPDSREAPIGGADRNPFGGAAVAAEGEQMTTEARSGTIHR
jgi:hypothetical protein